MILMWCIWGVADVFVVVDRDVCQQVAEPGWQPCKRAVDLLVILSAEVRPMARLRDGFALLTFLLCIAAGARCTGLRELKAFGP